MKKIPMADVGSEIFVYSEGTAFANETRAVLFAFRGMLFPCHRETEGILIYAKIRRPADWAKKGKIVSQ